MLQITALNYSVEGRPLFEEATATIPDGHKVGLVGRNGAGKTTLFRLIRDELALDAGSISLPARARIGGVAQEVPSSETSLLDTVLAADTERAALLAESETATDPTRIADIRRTLPLSATVAPMTVSAANSTNQSLYATGAYLL